MTRDSIKSLKRWDELYEVMCDVWSDLNEGNILRSFDVQMIDDPDLYPCKTHHHRNYFFQIALSKYLPSLNFLEYLYQK